MLLAPALAEQLREACSRLDAKLTAGVAPVPSLSGPIIEAPCQGA